MNQGEIDFRAFAHLRGKQDKSSLKWGLLVGGLLFLSGFLLLLNEISRAAVGC
jgi:hypothetical protein